MDAGGAPQGIRRRHPGNQGVDLGADGRAAPARPVRELGPVLAEAAPLPTENGAGGHDDEGLSPAGPDPGQPHPEEAIRWAEFRPGHHAPVHGELLPQGEVLQGELAVAAAEEREESYQVEQRADHGQDSLWIRSEDQSPGTGTGFWRGTADELVKAARPSSLRSERSSAGWPRPHRMTVSGLTKERTIAGSASITI